MKLVFAISFVIVSSYASVAWNGNFNSYASTQDLDNWSWQNNKGEYQTYIYGNSKGEKMSNWGKLDASYKNPFDKEANKGIQLHINTDAVWNGNSGRCEMIALFDKNTVYQGTKYFIFSMKHDETNPLKPDSEHQLVFFESHFADIKYGGNGGNNLYFVVSGSNTGAWSTPFPAGTWVTLGMGINYSDKTVSLYTIDTNTNVATQVVAPRSANVDSADWHVGIFRLPNGGTVPTEIIYYSSVSIQTDLNSLPFGGSGTTGPSVSTSSATTGATSSSSTSIASTTSVTTSSSSLSSTSSEISTSSSNNNSDNSSNSVCLIAVSNLVIFLTIFSFVV